MENQRKFERDLIRCDLVQVMVGDSLINITKVDAEIQWHWNAFYYRMFTRHNDEVAMVLFLT